MAPVQALFLPSEGARLVYQYLRQFSESAIFQVKMAQPGDKDSHAIHHTPTKHCRQLAVMRRKPKGLQQLCNKLIKHEGHHGSVLGTLQ